MHPSALNLWHTMAQGNNMSSLEALIKAAQYLEENGEGGPVVEIDGTSTSRSRNSRTRVKKPSSYSRTTHNLLEKNRRAQLRDCLEVLRQHVPFPDKLTTLALLQSARKYIETLQVKEKEEKELKAQLERKNALLLTRLADMGAQGNLIPASSPTSSSMDQLPGPSGVEENDAAVSSSPLIENKTNSVTMEEEEENMVIDIIHDSEDDTSSTTSGSDGGTTSTSHKYEL